MKNFLLKVYPSQEKLEKENQLAWHLAKIALDPAPISEESKEMIINRIIDNSAVAVASLNREPVIHARDQALAHPLKEGACLFGLDNQFRFSPEWTAWANGVAVRELDFHDTYLAEDYSHPADNIPTLVAIAQSTGKNGRELLTALLSAYEIHISLVKGICLHKHKIDHIAHLCPAQAGGLGTLLNMTVDQTYQAIQQAVHVSFTTRQSRKGEISSWKAYAPAFSGKMAIEAVDRALRGEKSPSPIYEGEDSVVAWLLDGQSAQYQIPLVEKGEEKKSILESYTKAHSAEYQAQAFIDLAFELREQIKDFSLIKKIRIYTSHHTHYVIGTGSGDPQKMSPSASRETLDHSISYIFTVALEDGCWHHIDSYTKKRANRPETIKIWHKVETFEEKKWTDLYKHPDPNQKAFGGRVEIEMQSGEVITAEKKLADAHPSGKKPFEREDYIKKFLSLTEELISKEEGNRFLDLVQNLENLSNKEVRQLNVQSGLSHRPVSKGIF
ncbi:MAG: MmgE/PrpD family protein [Bdellovibrionaceae bacterium]|nr:MmgE/PrpD family protein [Pseudobdellovibrionaceae bacterium]